MAKADLTAARLRELLAYDPATGFFTWRVERGKARARAGARAGSAIGTTKYWRVGIDRVNYTAHRLAWLYTTGAWPALDVDHIDGNPLNNSLSNLRVVSTAINQQNLKRANSNNKLGVLGVVLDARGKFRACIRIDGKTIHLGRFDSAELAHAAYLTKKREIHPGSYL